MNLTKKVLSLFTAFLMILSLAAPIKAAGEYKITISNTNSGHTYEAYQIFTGDLSENAEGKLVLSNVKWGKNVTAKEGHTLGDAIEVAKQLDEKTLTLETLLTQINLGSAVATDDYDENKYELTGLDAGYYLVKDQDGSLTLDHDAYTDYIIKVVENITVNPKSVYPTVDKQVWDEPADAEDGAPTGWNETADHDINEVFQFKLIATLPNSVNYASYKTYRVIFRDQMTNGITFVSIASVVMDGVTLTEDQYDCSIEAGEEQVGGEWSLAISDVKEILGDKLDDGATITVIYNAYLNETAKLNNDKENKNTVYLQYSNNPNVSGSGDNYPSDDTSGGDDDTPGDNDNELGETPKDSVWVFTYQVNVTKVDGSNEEIKLPNAQFKLSKELKDGTKVYLKLENGKVKEWTTVDLATILTSDANGEIKIIGLDHGEYDLTEIVAPEGYNLLKAPVKVKINATHNENTDEASADTVFTTDSTLSVKVTNNKGATLPETGGIGTTLIYLIGSSLAVLSVLLIVTKKRMNG